MDVRFVVRSAAKVSDEQKRFMESKLDKVEKFFDKIGDVQIVLDYKRGMNIVEVTANARGLVMRGEDHSPDMRSAFERALKNIERQIKRHKDYLVDRKHIKSRDISFDIPAGVGVDEEDESPMDIIKRKRFPVTTMTPEEAARQMDLLGHTFFIFRSGDSGELNVVYRRLDGGYGLLEPQE